jgi:hypothetical protein
MVWNGSLVSNLVWDADHSSLNGGWWKKEILRIHSLSAMRGATVAMDEVS